MTFLWALVFYSAPPPPPPPSPAWLEKRQVEWTYTIHRWIGYSLVLGSLVQGAIGWYTLNAYEHGQVPPGWVRQGHRIIGYTIAFLSSTNSAFGIHNLIRLQQKEKIPKRILHGTLSLLATSGYVTAVLLARQARERGDLDRYRLHRTAALLSIGATLLTVGVIIW